MGVPRMQNCLRSSLLRITAESRRTIKCSLVKTEWMCHQCTVMNALSTMALTECSLVKNDLSKLLSMCVWSWMLSAPCTRILSTCVWLDCKFFQHHALGRQCSLRLKLTCQIIVSVCTVMNTLSIMRLNIVNVYTAMNAFSTMLSSNVLLLILICQIIMNVCINYHCECPQHHALEYCECIYSHECSQHHVLIKCSLVKIDLSTYCECVYHWVITVNALSTMRSNIVNMCMTRNAVSTMHPLNVPSLKVTCPVTVYVCMIRNALSKILSSNIP